MRIPGLNVIEVVLLWHFSGSCGISGVYDVTLKLGLFMPIIFISVVVVITCYRWS